MLVIINAITTFLLWTNPHFSQAVMRTLEKKKPGFQNIAAPGNDVSRNDIVENSESLSLSRNNKMATKEILD